MSIKIIIADDHPLIRIGLRNIIKATKAYEVIAEAENGKEALELVRKNKPDLLILDIEMPELNGLDVCKAIRKENLSCKILFLTMLKEREVFNEALKLDCDGFLWKEDATNELENAISEILKNKKFISESIRKQVTNLNSSSEILKTNKKIDTLTKTEKDILTLISKNFSTKEIGLKMFISESTVKNHRNSISKKLELSGEQNALLKFAIKNAYYLQ